MLFSSLLSTNAGLRFESTSASNGTIGATSCAQAQSTLTIHSGTRPADINIELYQTSY